MALADSIQIFSHSRTVLRKDFHCYKMKVGAIKTALRTMNILNKLRWISNLCWIRKKKKVLIILWIFIWDFGDFIIELVRARWGKWIKTQQNCRKSLSHQLQGRNFPAAWISLSLVSQGQHALWLCSCWVWAAAALLPSAGFSSAALWAAGCLWRIGCWCGFWSSLFNPENAQSTPFISLFCTAQLPQG